MKPNLSESAIVIGAGLSGLAAAKELHAHGIPVTVLEATDQIATPWRVRHPKLRLNIHRKFTRLPEREMIKDDGIFVSKNAVIDYLNDYGETLGAPILFDTQVTAVRREGDIWHLVTNKGEFDCTQLIVATGRERMKSIPIWPGMEDFTGELIHSADFADPSEYDGKKVLVIGAGNSGTDVLNHLSRANPDKVWVSVRHGPTILPSRIFGYPMHALANVLARFPKWSMDPVFAIMQRVFIGDLRRYGLRRHKMGGASRMLKQGITFALDDGFAEALKAGRFDALSETVGFTPNEVEMRTGRRVQPDVVICATGYHPGLENVFGHLGALNERGYPLHPMGQADARNPGLWFTGYSAVFQGFFYAAGISARRIATQIVKQSTPTIASQTARRVSKSKHAKGFIENGIRQ